MPTIPRVAPALTSSPTKLWGPQIQGAPVRTNRSASTSRRTVARIGDCTVCRGFIQDARGISYEDTAARGGSHINVVESGGDIGHDAQARPGSLQHLVIDSFCEHGNERRSASASGQQLRPRRGEVPDLVSHQRSGKSCRHRHNPFRHSAAKVYMPGGHCVPPLWKGTRETAFCSQRRNLASGDKGELLECMPLAHVIGNDKGGDFHQREKATRCSGHDSASVTSEIVWVLVTASWPRSTHLGHRSTPSRGGPGPDLRTIRIRSGRGYRAGQIGRCRATLRTRTDPREPRVPA